MYTALILLLLGGAPFWETKAPEDWSDDELAEVLTRSPWVKTLEPPVAAGGVPAVTVYLAGAQPMVNAEREAERRARLKRPVEDPPEEEYREFLRENRGSVIVLAVEAPDSRALRDPVELRKMEDECFLRGGGKKHRMTGHFPPSPSDPRLRLVFPRALGPQDRRLVFELYLPSIPAPYRTVEFDMRDLIYKGKPEM